MTPELRLINANELMDYINALPEFRLNDDEKGDVFKAIRLQPIIDAVPVVRCRECKYHDLTPSLIGTVYCTCLDAVVKEDGYCCEGKRRYGGAGCMKDRINRILEIMAEFNEENDDCDHCPFYDAQCSGDSDKACLVQDLTDIVRIVVQKDVLKDDTV